MQNGACFLCLARLRWKLTSNFNILIILFSYKLLSVFLQVLAVLKNDRLKDRDRKRDTEELLGGLADERFAVLVNLGKKITDFGVEGASHKTMMGGPVSGQEEDMLDETHGVNVQFQDTDDEDDEDGLDEVCTCVGLGLHLVIFLCVG